MANPEDEQPIESEGVWTKKSVLWKVAVVVIVIVALLVSLITVSIILGDKVNEINSQSRKKCSSPECIKVGGLMLSYMDTSVNPCHDFFKYSCGQYGRKILSTTVVAKETNSEIHHDLRDYMEQKYVSGEPIGEAKARRFYHACMNVTRINLEGKAKMTEIIDKLGGLFLKTGDSLPEDWSLDSLLIQRDKFYSAYPFIFSVEQNFPRDVLSVFFTGGRNCTQIGVCSNAMKFLTSYAEILIGDNMVDRTKIEDIMKMEAEFGLTEIADLFDGPRKYSLKDLDRVYHNVMNWKRYVQHLFKILKQPIDIEDNEFINVHGVNSFRKFDEKMRKEPNFKVTVHNYVVLKILEDYADDFGGEFKAAHDEFLEKVGMKSFDASGTGSIPPRWYTCLSKTDKYLNKGLHAIYARKFMTPEVISKTEKLVSGVRKSSKRSIRNNEWIGDTIKDQLLNKVTKMKYHLGYGKNITNKSYQEKHYQDLIISPSHVDNIENAKSFAYKRHLSRLHQEIENEEPDILTLQVNAYYYRNKNEMVIVPSILAAPYFYRNNKIPAAITYGGIGFVIGHEIGHSFQDNLSNYDFWETPQSLWHVSYKPFKEKAKCLINQYNNYQYNGYRIDGDNTFSENLADNIGLPVSYLAYKTDIADEPTLTGLNLTGEQLFFVSYAQTFCEKYSPKTLRDQINGFAHSPNFARVNVPLSNLEPFAKAFQCNKDDPLNAQIKCRIL